MLNRASVLADNLGLKVEYKGVSPQKQHLFSTGGPLINHVFNTLEEAVERFGGRINIDEKRHKLSLFFKMGYESASYAPLASAKQPNLIEYGLGRMKQLIERGAPKKAEVPPPVVRLPPRAPVAPKKAEPAPAPTFASTPTPVKRGPGRPPKARGLDMGAIRQAVGK